MIVNLTPHPIDIYAPDVSGAVPDGVEPIRSIAPEPVPARLSEAVLDVAAVEDIPLTYVEYGLAVSLPEPERGTWLVVALPVALARPDRRDLLIPYRLVRNAAGTVVGCRGLARPVVPVS